MIRALAILLVCTAHQTLWPIPGGAAAMVVLIGYNLARFQRTALAAGDFAAFFRPLGLVLAPYYVLVAAYAVASGQIPWASVALIGNFGLTIPETHLMLPYLYWFVEAFAQIWLLVAAAFLLPPVRRMAAADPFRLGLWFLGAAVAARVAQPFVCPLGMRDIFTVPWVLHLCALGWLAACADTPRRKAATVLLAAPVLAAAAYWGGNWVGSWIKFGLQLPVLALLLYAPRVPLPKAARRLILPVAAASFQIYLTHRFAPELILAPFEANVPAPLFDAVAIAGGVALGLGAHRLQLVARRRIAGWRERWEAAPAEAAPR
jgi:hypothetical protein